MMLKPLLVAGLLCAIDPGFGGRFYSPQSKARTVEHFEKWQGQLLVVARDLLAGSDVDSNALSAQNPRVKSHVIHQNYRASVAGEHFVVSFHDGPEADFVQTKKGVMALLQIVVALKPAENGSAFKLDALYSIDEEGCIHQHLQRDAAKIQAFDDFARRVIGRRVD